MVTINLLPWREKYKTQKKKQFFQIIRFSFAITSLLAGGIFLYLHQLTEKQQEKNLFLKSTLFALEPKIQALNLLKILKKTLIHRTQILYNLQLNSTFNIRLMEALIKILPKGMVLTQMTYKDQELKLSGKSESNTQIFTFMTHAEKSTWFSHPVLKEMTPDRNDEGQEIFTLLLKVRPQFSLPVKS